MTPQERIEEAHGLWEIAVTRALALATVERMNGHGDAAAFVVRQALDAEQSAFEHWRSVSWQVDGEQRAVVSMPASKTIDMDRLYALSQDPVAMTTGPLNHLANERIGPKQASAPIPRPAHRTHIPASSEGGGTITSRTRWLVLNEIVDERARQDVKWGGPERDDEHDRVAWLDFINGQRLAAADKSAAEFRQRMIKIAALAVAAVESTDRLVTR